VVLVHQQQPQRKINKPGNKANAGLPDNAFADNVVVDESHGVYYPKSLQMEIDTNDTQII